MITKKKIAIFYGILLIIYTSLEIIISNLTHSQINTTILSYIGNYQIVFLNYLNFAIGIVTFLFLPGILILLRKQNKITITLITSSLITSILLYNIIFFLLKILFHITITRIVMISISFILLPIFYFINKKERVILIDFDKKYLISGLIFILIIICFFSQKIVLEDEFDDSIEIIEISKSLEHNDFPKSYLLDEKEGFQTNFVSFAYILHLIYLIVGVSPSASRIMGLIFFYLATINCFNFFKERKIKQEYFIYLYGFFIIILLGFYSIYEIYSDLTYPGILDMFMMFFSIGSIIYFNEKKYLFFIISILTLSTIHTIGFIYAILIFLVTTIIELSKISTKELDKKRIKIMIITLISYLIYYKFSLVYNNYANIFMVGSAVMQYQITKITFTDMHIKIITSLIVTVGIPFLYIKKIISNKPTSETSKIYLIIVLFNIILIGINKYHPHYYIVIFPLIGILLLDLSTSIKRKKLFSYTLSIILVIGILLLLPKNYSIYDHYSTVGKKICIDTEGKIDIDYNKILYQLDLPKEYRKLPLNFEYNIKKNNCDQDNYSIIISTKQYENFNYSQKKSNFTYYYFNKIELDNFEEINSYTYLGNKFKEMIIKYKI